MGELGKNPGERVEQDDREIRLAYLLADGSGDFDFARILAFKDLAYLVGHVKSAERKCRAEELARYVGFREVDNRLMVIPES